MSNLTPTPPPGSDDPPTSPAIGRDEWVARRQLGRRLPARFGFLEDRLRRVPWWAWLALFLAGASMMPVISDSGYVRRIGFDTAIYMLLALGLNVVVGWGGLLDLGYVAFYGVGAYAYALLSSNQLDVHLPTIAAIPSVIAVGVLVGFLVGLPSRRLSGDYLAIVTLFFLQIFLTVTTNGDDVAGHNLTGGASGILKVDPISFFGHELPVQHGGVFAVSYYYVALGFFALAFVALRFVNLSRMGRAWRSQREDPLAAEVMGMPVNWIKLVAFAFGAAVAALSGALFTSLNSSVFPLTFSFPLLITVYTMVILGGQGSQAGVVTGAILVSVLLEELRDPNHSRAIFYIMVGLGLLGAFKFSRRLPLVAAATIGFGFAAHAVADSIHHSWVSGSSGAWASGWVIVPTHLASWLPTVAYVALIASVLALTLVEGWLRTALLVPVLYLAAFVWENVMLAKPEPTRYIVLGLILVSLMIVRPNGLLGEKRVEIV